jgi:hypothetical protein
MTPDVADTLMSVVDRAVEVCEQFKTGSSFGTSARD